VDILETFKLIPELTAEISPKDTHLAKYYRGRVCWIAVRPLRLIETKKDSNQIGKL
jgi:hypothetical protein